MEKSHFACLLAGAAFASAFFLMKSKSEKKKEEPQPDYESIDYLNLKNEQLARVVKYFGE